MYRSHLEPCHRGLKTGTDPGLLERGMSPSLQNMEFTRGTAKKRNGSRKLTHTAIRNGGLRFDGISGWLYIPNVAEYTDATIRANLTVELHVRFDALSGGATPQVIWAKSDLSAAAGARNQVMITQEQSGGVEAIVARYTDGGPTERSLISDTAVPILASKRYHIAFTYVDGRQNLFVYNLDDATTSHNTTTAGTGSLLNLSAPILIGAAGRTSDGQVDFTSATFVNDKPISAIVDEVRLWAATLASGSSASAALTTYQNRELDTAHTNASLLRGYWRLNDRNGTSAVDLMTAIRGSGTNNNAFLEPLRTRFVDGILPDEQGFAIRCDGYIDSAVVPIASPSLGTIQASYGVHFAFSAAPGGTRPVWLVEFSFQLLESVASQNLLYWVTDNATNNIICEITTTAGGVLQARISANDTALAAATTVTLTGTTVLALNTTYHVAVARELTAAPQMLTRLIVNGVQEATNTTAGNQSRGPEGNVQDLILARGSTVTDYSNVSLDEIRIWSEAQTADAAVAVRTVAKVLQYYDKPLPSKERNILARTGGGFTPLGAGQTLVHYWTCDDNIREYNDAPSSSTERWATQAHIAASDSGGNQASSITVVIGSLSLLLKPGSHVPEWSPGLLSGAVQGGLVDGTRVFKKSDGTQQVVLTAEGSIQTLGSDTSIPAAITTQKASGFQGGQPASFVATGDRLYFTNGLSPPLVWDGTTVRRWGIQGPAFTPYGNPVVTAGTAGDVQYRYTFVSRASGAESDPSPPSAVIRPDATNAAVFLFLTQSPDTQVDAIRIYRTTHGRTSGVPKAGSTDFFLVDEITNNPTASSLFTSYTDMVTDADLGSALSSDSGFKPSGPPPWCRYAAFFNGRMFLAYESRNKKSRQQVFYSESLLPENFGALNFLTFESGEGEPVTGLFPFYDRLAVFKRTSTYVLSGFGPSTFQQALIDPEMGTISGHSLVYVDNWLYLLTHKGPARFNGVTMDWIGREFHDTWLDFEKANSNLIVSGHNADLHQVWWGLRASSSSTSNDRCIVYDYDTGTFSVHTGLYPQSMHGESDTQANQRLFYGDDSGFLWRATNEATSNDGDLGFSGTTSGTATGGGTAGGFATITVTGNHVATGDNWRGLRIEVTRGAVTAEARILVSPSSGGVLVLDKTPAQLGFTPDSTTTYRIAAIDAFYETRPIALVAPGELARVEEVELELRCSTDNNANTASVSTVTLSVSNFREYSGTAEATLTQAETVGNAASATTFASVTDRFNLKSRAKRYAVRVSNDRPHEGFEIRDITVRFVPQERT